MAREYSNCFYCGGAVEEKLVSRELRWEGRLFVFENVPMGVCTRCGEKVLKPDVTKAIDKILEDKGKPAKIIQVPVYEYELNHLLRKKLSGKSCHPV